jgi:hypothetical protein
MLDPAPVYFETVFHIESYRKAADRLRSEPQIGSRGHYPTALLKVQEGFRRLKGYTDLPKLIAALAKPPSPSDDRRARWLRPRFPPHPLSPPDPFRIFSKPPNPKSNS